MAEIIDTSNSGYTTYGYDAEGVSWPADGKTTSLPKPVYEINDYTYKHKGDNKFELEFHTKAPKGSKYIFVLKSKHQVPHATEQDPGNLEQVMIEHSSLGKVDDATIVKVDFPPK